MRKKKNGRVFLRLEYRDSKMLMRWLSTAVLAGLLVGPPVIEPADELDEEWMDRVFVATPLIRKRRTRI